MAKPPITITCECGETKDVPYGERWLCTRCGRAWNTAQIPAEEYHGLLRRVRRRKLEALGLAAVFAAVLVSLIVAVSESYVFLTPAAAAVWLFFVRPVWRGRLLRAARAAPRWDLHPD